MIKKVKKKKMKKVSALSPESARVRARARRRERERERENWNTKIRQPHVVFLCLLLSFKKKFVPLPPFLQRFLYFSRPNLSGKKEGKKQSQKPRFWFSEPFSSRGSDDLSRSEQKRTKKKDNDAINATHPAMFFIFVPTPRA